jgi:hypothetical protein
MKQWNHHLMIALVALLSNSCGKIIDGRTSDGSSLEDTARTLTESAPPCSNGGKRIFVTAATHNGNLGGVAGADARCMSDSNKPGGTSTYKALIVDGSSRVACTTGYCSGGASEHVDWVLSASRSYYRTDCTTLITTTTASGLLSFGLTNTIHPSSLSAWTGTSINWVAGNTCGSWTSSAAGSNGELGVSNYSNFGALNPGGITSPDSCDNTFRLYCVEQ